MFAREKERPRTGKKAIKGGKEKEKERERHAHYAPHSLLSHKFKPVACSRERQGGKRVHGVESSPNRDSIDAPVIVRTANPDATRNSLSRPRGEPSELAALTRSMCDVVASWSNGGQSGVATEGTAEEAELSLLSSRR